jgi:hypothetical protein
MRALVRLLAVAAFCCFAAIAAHAQSSALVVPACGTQTPPFTAGGLHVPLMDVNGNLCSSATSSGGTFTWPGTAPLTNYGTAPAGTVPAVNANVTNIYQYTAVPSNQYGLTIASATLLTVPATATYGAICAETATVRYTTDGATTPTSTVGMPLAAGACVAMRGHAVLVNFKAIGAGATIDAEYFK